MTEQERDKVLKLTRKIYGEQGCLYLKDDREMIEYLYDSQHPAEITSLRLALFAHEVYTGEEMDDSEFFG